MPGTVRAPRTSGSPSHAGGTRRSPRRRLRTATVAVAAAWTLAVACAPGPVEPELSVLLVSLDTTRADRLGPYGFSAVATPTLDRLAAEGVVFETVTAPAPLTVPSHASLMTALDPPRHGVRDNGRYQLADEHRTLAENLAEAGWATGAQVGVFVLNRGTGIEQGFAAYRDTTDAAGADATGVRISERATNELRADVVIDAAIDWLRRHAERPFFQFVHLFDPHAPYDPPEPFRSRHERADPDPTVGRYLGEIAWTDHQLGRLIDALDELDAAARTLVVVTADHGEAFGEHGEIGHSYFVYDTTVRVPLIVRLPGVVEPGRVATPVRLVDVAPTVLELLGAPPLADVDGRSLVPLLHGERSDLGLFAYSETLAPYLDYRYAPLHAMRAGRWKYIRAPRPELYDLVADPDESINRVGDEPQIVARLEARLDERLRAAPSGPTVEIDDERRRRLEALGYVTARAQPTAAPRRDALADPKDRIEEMTTASTALRAFYDGELDRAVTLYRELVDGDPDHALFRSRLAETLLALRRHDEAAIHYRALLVAGEDEAAARRGLATVALSRGEAAVAAGHLQRLLELSPTDVRAWLDYGNLLAAGGRPAEAYAAFERAESAEPGHPEALLLMARLDWLRGRHADAAAALERAAAHPRAPGEVSLQLAWLLATSPEPSLRDGSRAVEIARRLPRGTVVTALALAAALAEQGAYDEAAATAASALDSDVTSPQDERWRARAAGIAATFRQRRPLRSTEPL